MNDLPRPAARSPKRLVLLLLVVPAAVIGSAAGSFGWPWYRWATAGSSPYDEVGIDVNLQMPGPLRRWACSRVAERFPRTLPPSGCERP